MNIRQGDVLLVKVSDLPDGVTRQAFQGRVVLAYGEVTGHSHTLTAEKSALFVDKAGRSWVVVDEPDVLEHQEHNPISLGVGIYRLIRQVEYAPEEIRRVAD